MKKVMLLGVMLLSFNSYASLEDSLANICTIVEKDDKSSLRSKMRNIRKDYGLSLKDYYNGISCSGFSLLHWAEQNGSISTGELMIKKLPKKFVQGLDGSFTNTDFQKALKGRIE